MDNENKYNNIFKKLFNLDESKIKGLKYNTIPDWDSVGHMSLIAELEDVFDIMMDTDDIIDFSSYKKGKKILSSKYNIKF